MKKVYAISPDGSHVAALLQAWQSDFRSALRHWWYQDSDTDVTYIIFQPRNLQELLTIEALPGLTLLPHIEDQMTKLPAALVTKLPGAALITTEHNTYQAALRLFRHYQWHPFHPLER